MSLFYEYNKAVVNGRYQIPHHGHFACIEKGLEVAQKVYVLIGSANVYPSTQNPFRPRWRENMIVAGLQELGWSYETIHSRIVFQYIDDSPYRDLVWMADVRDAVEEREHDRITMVGYKKDSQSWWLDTFGWELTDVEPFMESQDKVLSATNLRKLFFTKQKIPTQLVPQSVSDVLKEYRSVERSEFKRLVAEYDHVQQELDKFKDYPYKASLNCSTGDAVVVCNGHVLLTKRGNLPGLGAYALPGGHKNNDETYLDCAIRELREEIELKVPERVLRGSIKDSRIFDNPTRSAPFCKPTLGVYIEIFPDNDGSLPRARKGEEVAEVMWMPIHQVRRNKDMFFDDHYAIIQYFLGI